MKLAGAVCDFTEPATGQNKLFFPVEWEILKDSYVYAILENDETD